MPFLTVVECSVQNLKQRHIPNRHMHLIKRKIFPAHMPFNPTGVGIQRYHQPWVPPTAIQIRAFQALSQINDCFIKTNDGVRISGIFRSITDSILDSPLGYGGLLPFRRTRFIIFKNQFLQHRLMSTFSFYFIIINHLSQLFHKRKPNGFIIIMIIV